MYLGTKKLKNGIFLYLTNTIIYEKQNKTYSETIFHDIV